MDLAEHFRVIWRHRVRVVLVSLLVGALVYLLSSLRADVFAAEALLSVTSGRAQSGETMTEDDTLFLVRNYAELALTRPILADAVLASALPISVATAEERVSAEAAGDAGFLSIRATGPSPGHATRLTKAVTDTLLAALREQQRATLAEALAPVEAEVKSVEEQLQALPADPVVRAPLQARYEALLQSATESRLRPTDRVVVVSSARAEPGPVSPSPRRDAVLAFLVALVVNAELAVVLASLTDRFGVEDDDSEISEVTGLPVLAQVPEGGGEAVVEAFRTLRTNLMFMDIPHPVRSVALVSVDPRAGKSFSSIQLATVAASLDIPVVMIDGDLRRPSLHRELGVSLSPGFGDFVAGASLDTVVRPVPDEPLVRVITGGAPVEDAAGVVGGRRFADLLDQLNWAGMIVVDTPAAALFADAMAIASQCDATLVVVDARRTRRSGVRRIIEQLQNVGANPIGVIVNRAGGVSRSRYSYYRGEEPATT